MGGLWVSPGYPLSVPRETSMALMRLIESRIAHKTPFPGYGGVSVLPWLKLQHACLAQGRVRGLWFNCL